MELESVLGVFERSPQALPSFQRLGRSLTVLGAAQITPCPCWPSIVWTLLIHRELVI